jgi:hypothetical protein
MYHSPDNIRQVLYHSLLPAQTQLVGSDFLIGYPSHVLLAACSENEVAREQAKGGIFTVALLEELRSPGSRARGDGTTDSERDVPKHVPFLDYLRGARPAVPITEQEDIRKMTYRGLIRNIRRNIAYHYGFVRGFSKPWAQSETPAVKHPCAPGTFRIGYSSTGSWQAGDRAPRLAA